MKFSRVGLLILFLAQFALFWQYAQREIIWAYPGNFDQSSYLITDYTLYRHILQDGLYPALHDYLRHSLPTGFMLPLQASLLHFICGPGRLTDLYLNIGYLILLETVVFATACWLTGRRVFGWLACGLLLMQQTAFLPAGGLFDFRIDFIACCLYGVFVCFVVRAFGSREKRWFAAAVGCALLMMSFRFITFAYLIGFSLTLFTSLLALRLLWRGRRRVTLVLAYAMGRTAALGAIVLAAGGTLIALNWQTIHDYYVVGHLTGNEKHVRAAEQGITNLTGHLTYYLSSLLRDQLGPAFVIAWLVLAALGLAGWLLDRRGAASRRPRRPLLQGDWMAQLLILFASLFAPWFILTLDEAKSGVVINVLVTPAVLLLFSLLARLDQARTCHQIGAVTMVSARHAWWHLATVVVLVLGSLNWLSHLSRQDRFSTHKASVDQIDALYDFLGDESASLGFTSPRVAADVIYDWAMPVTINTAIYERGGRWLDSRVSLGGGIAAVSREEVFADLAQTDIALITTFPKEGTYPFYASIRPLSGEITTWCETHLLRARVFKIDDQQVTAYLRPNVPLEGLSGGWITPAGVRARLSDVLLAWLRANGKGTLVLTGNVTPAWLPKTPAASAQPRRVDDTPITAPCPAEFIRPDPSHYQLRVDLRALLPAVPAGADAVIALRLDNAYFVPKALGINDDIRQLVVNGPTGFHFE